MRIKVDEHLKGRTVAKLQSFGHDVDTVQDEGLTGVDDEVVYRAALNADRLLITLDRDFSDTRRFRVGEHGGLVFLRLKNTRQDTIDEALDILHRDHKLEDFAGCYVVVRPPYIRITRPS